MDGYELERVPLYVNSNRTLKLFRGTSLEHDRKPVIVKRYDLSHFGPGEDIQREFHRVLKIGMTQTRVDHPSFCKILDMKVDFSNYPEELTVFHVLEALDMDLGREIEERKRTARPFSEAELRSILVQASSALAFAHSKVKCN